MNEFFSGAGTVTAVKNTADRGKASLKSVPTIKGAEGRTEAGLQASVTLTDRASGASAYAKLQSNIADILADLKASGTNPGAEVSKASRAISSLMPQPVIMLPMPPTDPNMVAFVAQVAQSVAAQAAQTRAAQAHATPMIVEAAAG